MKHSSGTETDRPSLGVVIPAFNREDTIVRAIESVLSQSLPAQQIVVVDDGSSDRTGRRAASCDAAVEVITQPNAGPSAARNAGVAELETEWVAFLDSDDYWTEGHLERMVCAIEATGGAADVYFSDSSAADLPPGMTWWQRCGFDIDGDREFRPDATDWLMRPQHPFRIQASVVSVERYIEAGGLWSELLNREDTHLFFRLGLGRPFCAVAGIAVEITDDDSSGRLTRTSGAGTATYALCTVLMYEDILRRFPNLPRKHRRSIERRLAEGNLDLAGISLRQRDPSGLKPAVRAFRLAPSGVVSRIAGVALNGGRRRDQAT